MQRAWLVLVLLITCFTNSVESYAAIDAIKGKWKEVFNCDFDSPDDLNMWTKQDATGSNGNNELSAYVTDAFKVKDGFLHIQAQKRDAKYGGKTMHYTSGLLNSKSKFEHAFGRYDIRVKVPKGKGLWPAFCLLPASGKWPPEIDIFEMLCDDPKRVYFTSHLPPDKGGVHPKNELQYDAKPDFAEQFHEVICVWSKSKIDYYVDGKKVASSSKHVPSEKMYMVLNLAVGGNWPGSPDAKTKFPSELLVDYVRVYDVDESAEKQSAEKQAAMEKQAAAAKQAASKKAAEPAKKPAEATKKPAEATKK